MTLQIDSLKSVFICAWLALSAISLLLIVVGGAFIDPTTSPSAAHHYATIQYIGIGLLSFGAFLCLPIGGILIKGTPSRLFPIVDAELNPTAVRRLRQAAPVTEIDCTYCNGLRHERDEDRRLVPLCVV